MRYDQHGLQIYFLLLFSKGKTEIKRLGDILDKPLSQQKK